MPITQQKSKELQVIAILMMLCLHLFNRDYQGLFQPLIFIGKQPLSYYISLFSDACVPIFAFVSGYGLYFKYRQDPQNYFKGNLRRLKKLYINYWVIIFLFVVVLGLALQKNGYPGTIWKLVGSLSGLEPGYNGAWWFFTIYVFFTLTSSFWFTILDKMNPWLVFGTLLAVYIVAFYFKIYKTSIFETSILQYLHRQGALYFCTLFQFLLGAFALKFNWNEKVATIKPSSTFLCNILALSGIVILIMVHGYYPNFILAPFTGLGFIFLYLQMNIGKTGTKILDFFTPHYTNMWLVHMFFYMIYFHDFVYSFKYVPLIFLILIALSVASSYIINFIIKAINQLNFQQKPTSP